MRYISGKTVSKLKDIIDDGQDYILILDEGCIMNIDLYINELQKRKPIAALSDYSLVFTHVPSFMQMLSIPLFFMPENRDRSYVTFYEQTHSLADSVLTKVISNLEDIRGIKKITIDTLFNIVYPHEVDTPEVKGGSDELVEVESYNVLASVKSKDNNDIWTYGSDEVGLIFTEFVFYKDEVFPTYEEQKNVLEKIFKRNPSSNYTVRLFDVNNDKVPDWLHGRIKLGNYDHPLFEPCFRSYLDEQLRCLCELAKNYPISILIPYVKSLRNIEYINECMASIKSPYRGRIKIGAKIELISTVKEIPALLDYVDFFSVGSNDLVHSFFGMERTHKAFEAKQMSQILGEKRLWDILYQIRHHADDKPIRMGGQLPIFPEALNRLLDIGYKEFTVSPQWVRQVKYQIKNYKAGN